VLRSVASRRKKSTGFSDTWSANAVASQLLFARARCCIELHGTGLDFASYF